MPSRNAKRLARDHLQVVGGRRTRTDLNPRYWAGHPSDRLQRLSSRSLPRSKTALAWVSALRTQSLKRTAASRQQKPVPVAQCFTSACPWLRHGGGNCRVACRLHRRRRCFFPDLDWPPLARLRLCVRAGRRWCPPLHVLLHVLAAPLPRPYPARIDLPGGALRCVEEQGTLDVNPAPFVL